MASLSREGKETKERDVSTVDYPSIETASLAKSFIYFILREKCSKKTPQKTTKKKYLKAPTGQTIIYLQYVRFKHKIYLEKVLKLFNWQTISQKERENA